MRTVLGFLILVLSVSVANVSAQPCGNGNSITVVPAEPTADEAITLQLRGSSPHGQSALFDTSHQTQGSTIRVDTNLNPGFDDPGSFYADDYQLGHLPPGTYTVEEWIQCWAFEPFITPYGEPYLAATTILTVGGGSVSAIPTLSEAGLGVLLTALVLAGMVLMRRRR